MKRIIVILVVLLMALAMLGYYYSNKSVKPTQNIPDEDKPVTINDKEVIQLYNYLSDNKMFNITDDKYKTIYQDKLVTYSDLTKYNILRNIFYRMEKEDASIDMYNTEMLSGNIEPVFNILDTSTIKFADECTPDNNDCIVPIHFNLNEVTGYYQINCDDNETCIWFLNGNDNVNDESLFKLINAEKSNNEYYLYDSVFYSDGKNLYDSYSKNNVIYTSPNDNLIDYKFVEENYKDYLFTYKHTYKQSGSGKYYWYSTELIK